VHTYDGYFAAVDRHDGNASCKKKVFAFCSAEDGEGFVDGEVFVVDQAVAKYYYAVAIGSSGNSRRDGCNRTYNSTGSIYFYVSSGRCTRRELNPLILLYSVMLINQSFLRGEKGFLQICLIKFALLK
jgi:hypothetical protein